MISFMRVDDRIIHGQIITRWSKEYPCDGIIAVNDKAATTPVLAQSFKASTDKKVFVWTKEHFKEVQDKVLNSPKRYFLITKNPVDMKEILVDMGFVPSDVKRLIIGPCNDRPGATKLGQNQSITQEEADAIEAITKKGYDVEFALLKETSIGEWPKFRSKFGY
ncbi:PTS sugar transporter subunit IIB [uncultured Dubosiella sp.]|uniref:PTS system mannose/fructose/N-acetylgalactosamine-transporter subunit IIB n=1 Tax=uncultured Dubosiella sp. TaxID=1937011 RepID=UPI000ED4B011|nr:PTS sugar transporter subunit IIB [uncultured Dubosiella sp.]GJM59053.1 PTS fructose transporter subunit IIB [Erysipelotrichaceae bacterium OPF54]GJM59169.1 PTS fructose transporter subunit IIB [Erysipelotrichaceae bacterium OPF54]HAM30466.1 PTS mannose/fructose/sorbose transporter subunit IIB [Erysipelotrichaceae bacterium]